MVTSTPLKREAVQIRRLMESRGYATPFRRTPTWRGGLRFHADWIFVNGFEVRRWGVEALSVSDHWPIWQR